MASRFEQEVRRTLSRYLAGDVGLQDLQTWLAPRAWDLDPLEDPSAYQLVGRIELILAEASSGHWTETEIREKFGPYAKIVELAHAPGVQFVTSGVIGKQPLQATIYVSRGPTFATSVSGHAEIVPIRRDLVAAHG